MRIKKSYFVMVFIVIIFNIISFKIVNAETKPVIQLITQPNSCYKNGDLISIVVISPNYKGRVQYRAFLYNINTKKTTELWYSPNSSHYNTNVTPQGNNEFRINWKIQNIESGTYYITILTRRLKSKVSYDSFVRTINFQIKQKLTVEDIAKFNKAVLLLNTYDINNNLLGSGSGFVISPYGRIVTNFHVIDKASSVKAVTYDGREYDVTGVLNFSKEQDIAILYIKDFKELSYVNLGDSDKVNLGQDIVAIGSPLGLQNTVSTGIISSIRRNMFRNAKGFTDFQISAPISHGSSGGALFDMFGDVIGITYAGLGEKGENLNFAIPINEIKPLLQSNTYNTFDNMLFVNHLQFSNDKYSKASTYLYQHYSVFTLNNYYLEAKNIYMFPDKNNNGKIITAIILDTQNYNAFKEILSYDYENGKKEIEEWLKGINLIAELQILDKNTPPFDIDSTIALFYSSKADKYPIYFENNQVKYNEEDNNSVDTKIIVAYMKNINGNYSFVWNE